MSLDSVTAQQLLDHLHGLAAMPMPTELRLRLMTASGDGDTMGTEVASGGGYVSGTGAPLLEYDASSVAWPSVGATLTDVVVETYPRTESIVGAEVWGLVGGFPQRLEYGDFDSPLAATTGSTVTIPAGDISAAMS